MFRVSYFLCSKDIPSSGNILLPNNQGCGASAIIKSTEHKSMPFSGTILLPNSQESPVSAKIVPSEHVSSVANNNGEKSQLLTLNSTNESSSNQSKLESRVHGGFKACGELMSILEGDMQVESVNDQCFQYHPSILGAEDMVIQTKEPEDETSQLCHDIDRPLCEMDKSPCEFDRSNLQDTDSGSPSVGSSQRGAKYALEETTITIKAKYRDDTVRFRVGFTYGYADILEEIARRFKLDVDRFDLKYLDDEEEWVMLTCNADLIECFDQFRFCKRDHVRLIVRDRMNPHGRSSDRCVQEND